MLTGNDARHVVHEITEYAIFENVPDKTVLTAFYYWETRALMDS